VGSTSTRLFYTAVLALAPFCGPGCVSSGAQFSPATGVLTVTGTEGADTFAISVNANGSIVVNGGGVPIAGGVPTLANTVRIVLNGLGGDDQLVLDQFGDPLPDAAIVGGAGADTLVGGAGDDSLQGGPGDDQILMGGGDDTFVWNPGDGLDTAEGQAGFDTLRFNGSDASENIDVYANGARVRFFRNVDAVTTDLGGVEAIDFAARGGADAVFVNDLTGTPVTRVGLDLAASSGGGDGQADSVTVIATQGDDLFGVMGQGGGIRVFGLQASVDVVNHEQANDRLILNAMGGADVVNASTPEAAGIQLTVNGGLGTDILHGSPGGDQFNGGDGNDFVFMGDGDDTFVWSPGDDLDTLEGQAGFDTLHFNGANVSENIDVSASGGRVRFFRNVANVTLDLDDVESIDFSAVGGSDLIFVNDLSGTDLLELNLALASAAGTGDAQPDSIFVQGTGADDSVFVVGDASLVSVIGLTAQVNITTAEIALDALQIFTLAGDDVVDGSGLTAPSILLTADGGADHDVLIGGDGGDILFGGDGDDVLLGGPGLDVLDGGAGDNIVIQ